jgi:hypothetical protein
MHDECVKLTVLSRKCLAFVKCTQSFLVLAKLATVKRVLTILCHNVVI